LQEIDKREIPRASRGDSYFYSSPERFGQGEFECRLNKSVAERSVNPLFEQDEEVCMSFKNPSGLYTKLDLSFLSKKPTELV
jgi:hypothetical protein